MLLMMVFPGNGGRNWVSRSRSGYYYYYYKCHVLECCHHTVAGALYKNLDLQLLHRSMLCKIQLTIGVDGATSATTDEKGETWSPSGMSGPSL